jgi:hypothetical protein
MAGLDPAMRVFAAQRKTWMRRLRADAQPKSKSETKWDDSEESQRFLDMAKPAEASDDPKDFDRALKKGCSTSRWLKAITLVL